MSSFKKKVIDKVSDVLSYPARNKARKSIEKSNELVKDIKLVRKTKDLIPYPFDDYSSEVFRARANVLGYKYDQEQNSKKKGRNTSDGYMAR